MKLSGKMMILDDDEFFDGTFKKTGDTFELQHLNKALSFVKKWDYALDGGAHYGSWTRQFAQRFGTVWAYEPRPDVYDCLVENTKEFQNVDPIRKALGDKMDSVTVGIGDHYDNSGCSTVIGPGDTPMVTIDSMNLPGLDFLKLDVEGFELHTLKGGEATLLKYKPVIIYEDKGHSEDYGVKKGDCGIYLESIGAKKLHTIGRERDFIYGW